MADVSNKDLRLADASTEHLGPADAYQVSKKLYLGTTDASRGLEPHLYFPGSFGIQPITPGMNLGWPMSFGESLGPSMPTGNL